MTSLARIAGHPFLSCTQPRSGGAVRAAALPEIGDGLVEPLRRDAGILENAAGLARHGERQKKVFRGDEGIACFLGCLFGGIQNAREFAGQINLARAAFDLGKFRQCAIVGVAHSRVVATCRADQPRSQALLIVEQDFQKMFRRELLIAGAERQTLSRLNEAARPLGELFNIHNASGLPRPGASNSRYGLRRAPFQADMGNGNPRGKGPA